ncbi:16276_t:CDS:2 [Dentiscutata heterogama]|uniref:16276_t:CDS:1 n=1 Tax=Dentiscutata heterogama TaxID=1316150 RepID=A0ACA9KNN2_9GLOM|nr:16276_t:CDS:2 [Dentiscutata heterogama]
MLKTIIKWRLFPEIKHNSWSSKNSDEDFTTSINTFNTIIDSDDIVTSSSATSAQDDSEDDKFITPPNNFGTHWTGFLCSKQVKNTKSRRYNAKCSYCNKVFEARKEAMISYITNICQKILADDKILYIRKINKKNPENISKSYPDEDIDISSKKRKATLTDFFNKASISPDKINELYTLLLQSLIYSNVPFRFVENPFSALFLKKLYSSYNLPSRYILTHRIMQAEYARVLLEMVDRLEESNDLTLSLDANNLLIAIETLLKNINLDFNKIIALVTDSPSVMVRLRKNISEKYKHIISIRFCLSVQNYEKGFKACLDYINNSNECPIIPIKIKEIVTSRRHFLENEQLTIILRYIVDAIGKLELRNTTVGDVFAELYKVYKKLKMSENSDIDQEFIEHAKNIINIRAKEFDEPIYYLSFFLHPKFRKIAVSKKLSLNNMLIYALTFAQKWNFTRKQANQISEQLNNYFNNEPPYNSRLSYRAEALKTLALKIFAIHPHAAGVEQLFSSMAVEAPKKVKNNQVSNNTNEDTNFVELEDYDTLFTSSSDTNDDIELESELQEIYTEFENSSDLFLEQLVNFDVEELILESINKENITKAEITS